jgi:hypothetical protein
MNQENDLKYAADDALTDPVVMEETKKRLLSNLSDQKWRLNNLYWIKTKQGEKIRFVMNDRQKFLFDTMHNRNVILKSRRHGVTTFFLLYMLDQCLFNTDINCGVIAHNKDDAQRLFREIIKYSYDNLDESIKRMVPIRVSSRWELCFEHNKNGRPSTSNIHVATSMRSGTIHILHISEFGKIAAKRPDHALEIISGAIEAVDTGMQVTIESTAEGNFGEFYEMCERARNFQLSGKDPGPLDYKFFFFPWHEDPDNNLDDPNIIVHGRFVKLFEEYEQKNKLTFDLAQKRWYIAKANDLKDLMTREHPSTPEEAFAAAIIGTYYKSQFIWMRQQGRITKVDHQPSIYVDTWWDLGYQDATCIWFSQSVGRSLHFIDYYENNMESLTHYRNYLDQLAQEKGYRYGVHMAPHDIEQHELGTGKTRKELAAEEGLLFNTSPKIGILDGIESVRRLFEYSWFDEKKCEKGLQSLENYRKEWNDRTGSWKKNPAHNWASHGSDAMRTCGIGHTFADRSSFYPTSNRTKDQILSSQNMTDSGVGTGAVGGPSTRTLQRQQNNWRCFIPS